MNRLTLPPSESLLVYVFLLFISCKSVHVFSKQQFETFRTTRSPGDISRLRYDGFFNNVTQVKGHEEYNRKIEEGLGISAKNRNENVTYCPNTFFANGVFMMNGLIDTKEAVLEQYKSEFWYKSRKRWGAYEIAGDTITLLVYQLFRNDFKLPRWDVKIAKYQGYILNDTTIINWRQVPPYPNRDKDQLDTAAQRLEFYYFPEKTSIDSNRIFNQP